MPYLLLNICAASNCWCALVSWSQRQGHTVPGGCIQVPEDSQPTWPPQCLILIEVNGNAESIQTEGSVLQVSVSVLSSVRASLLGSSTVRAAEEAPQLPFPTLTLSRGAGLPRQNHVLPYLFLQQPLSASCPFSSPCRRHLNLVNQEKTKNQTATSVS